jgi:Flp pilus assembly protein TadB
MNPSALIAGITIGLLALLVLLFLVIAPPAPRVKRDRRLAPGASYESALSRVTSKTTAAVDSAISRGRGRFFSEEALNLAGIRSEPSQFVVIVASATSVAALLGAALGLASGTSVLLALLFAVVTPIVARLFVSNRTSKRRAKFADQIDDVLQLVAGSLRAGHGLSTSIASVAADADAPMGEELTRAVNESRLGRSLAEALAITAQRMKSKDFDWVAQAIAINAEAGGNLAEVLEQVSRTIRERNQIRRQVAALSAEGRLSGVILIALPILLFLFFAFVQPMYTEVFFTTLIGIVALVVAGLLMVAGTVWMAFVVRVRF